ncbi:MAG: hypothetical protein JKY65_02910 [Planctomycetes bacterium]|nr:hypothetical protein [Planctomycetota bacterium]
MEPDPEEEEHIPPARDQVERFLEDYATAREGRAFPLYTYFADLDELLGGLRPGELSLLAARPATGATTLALSIVRSLSVLRSTPTVYESTTLSPAQMIERIVAGLGKLPVHSLRYGFLSRGEVRTMTEAAELIAAAPLHLALARAKSLEAILDRWTWLRREHKVQLFVFDGLADLASGSESEAASLVRRLRTAARELEAHVLVLCPLHPSAEGESSPTLSDLWGGLKLELTADKILLLSRAREPASAEGTVSLALRVAINKSGATGVALLDFRLETLRIQSATVL